MAGAQPSTTRSAARPDWAALALLGCALIAAAPLWAGPGLVNTRAGGDSPFLFIRLHQLVENLRAGVFPVRWMPDAAYGLGYPFFNFYAALPYYFAAIFTFIGFDWLAAIKIAQSLGFVFAAFAMYGWIRSAAADTARRRSMAWLAAVAYTFAPFHMVNVYVRGDSLSEFYAFVFYPLILWAIDRTLDRPGPRSIALLALAYGGLVLTHNISALIFTPFALLYIALHGVSVASGRPKWAAPSRLLRPAAGLALGLLVSAWFWLPALGEAHLVQLDAQTTGYFNYSEHFRSANLIQPWLGFDYGTEPPRTPFAMGWVQAVATLAGVGVLLATWRRGSSRLRLFTLAGLVASTLMITPWSKRLWDTLPLLPLVQFPWRFLSVQALFSAAAIGYLAQVGARWVPALTGLALAAAALVALRPDYLPIRADEITPERMQLYEAFTTNIGTTIRAEYLPRTTTPRPYTGPALIDPSAPPRAIPVRGEAEASQLARGPTWQAWSVEAASASALAFPILYFPGWQASIDGEPTEARAAADLGTIEVEVPAGRHAVELRFGRTPIRAAGEIVSLAAAVAVGVMLLRRRSAPDPRRVMQIVSARRYEIGAVLVAGALAALASAANAVDADDHDLVMDFASKPWLHHAGPVVGDSIAYQYAQPLEAGEPFTVTIDWSGSAAPGRPAIAQLVAPSLHAFGGPEALVTSQGAPLPAGIQAFSLEVPAALAKGMYYVTVAGQPAGGDSVSQVLQPVFSSGSPAPVGQPIWARIHDDIELRSVHVKHDRDDRLTVAFDWAAVRPIAANYAVSLRLRDATGRVWASLDTQPGYGFLPTSAWLPGENQRDTYTLALPPDLPRDQPVSIDAVWYRVASQQEIGRVRVPGIELDALYSDTEMPPPPRRFAAPPMEHRVDATFGGAIRLLGFDAEQAGRRLTLTLHWQAVQDIGADYKFFVHVIDPATQHIIAQADAMPGGHAAPTSGWIEGEIVSEPIEFDLPPGAFRVATGWYDAASAIRLPALDAQGNAVPDDQVILIEAWQVP